MSRKGMFFGLSSYDISILALIHFRFDELEVGALPPIRLNFLGSRAILGRKGMFFGLSSYEYSRLIWL
jgi:hypothetical protein